MATPKEERTVEIIVNGQKAFASLKEMNAAAAVLYSQFQKMSGDDPGRAKLVADYQGLKGKIAGVKTELTGVSQGAGVMKQAFANAFAIFTGGGILGLVQQVFGFLSSAKDEFQGSAKASADLEATLLATKNAAGLTAAEIRAIGEARAKVTLFDDDETNRASAMLLTFKNVKKGVFEDAIPAIQDLATKMGGDGPADMKGASIQLGKALNDPIKGITALTRVGVTFTDQQKEQIAAMVKAGDVAGAQRVILAELNSEFGGSAEAARQAAGGMATLSMRWGEMKETVGGVVSGVLNDFSQWLGRVLDESQPLIDMLVDIGEEFAVYYRELMDVAEGLGIFSEKTDTAKMVVEFLKGALTLLLLPIRVLLQVSKAVVDTFIDWYNKSEMLRGVIGGLAAVVTTTFKAIKDDAIKYLGGVGDILVGIFTLDKDRILKGFRSTMEATADLALGQGQRAAESFAKGYEANKNNKIVRLVRVETSETSSNAGGSAAGGGEEAAGESAKNKKAREGMEKKRLAALEKAHKAEAEAEIKHQEMLINLQEAALIAKGTQREREIGAITFDAQRKALTVRGTEEEKRAAVALISAEAQVKKQELQAKFDEEDRAQRQQHLADLLADEDAAEVEREADFEAKFADALVNQQEYDQMIYDAKRASLEAKLVLEEQYGSNTSKLYRATYKELQKLDRDKNKADLEDARKTAQEKRQIALLGLQTAGDVVQTTIDLFFKDEAARKKHHNMYTALAGAKIVMDGLMEVAAIWKYGSENPLNFATGGAVGLTIASIQTALAAARTGFALTQLQAFSFAKGGRTGGGMMMGGGMASEQGGGMAVSPMGQLMQMSGMRMGSNGKLVDDSGFAVAGIVHQDEYVVPAWMRKDPEVAAVENWLEARRLRGFADGGATSAASLPTPNPLPESDSDLNYAVQVQMLAALRSLESMFGDVSQWQRDFKVHQNLQEVRSGLDTLKQVEQESAIRA